MAPLPPSRERARTIPKSTFSSTFSRFKTSHYNDRPPSHPVSSSHAIRTLSWNALGSLIATGAGDRTLRIWNPERPHVKNSTDLKGHSGAVERVVFRPTHESELASCGTDGTVRVWDVRRKDQVGEVKIGNEVLFLAWTPDGKELLAGTKVRWCSKELVCRSHVNNQSTHSGQPTHSHFSASNDRSSPPQRVCSNKPMCFLLVRRPPLLHPRRRNCKNITLQYVASLPRFFVNDLVHFIRL